MRVPLLDLKRQYRPIKDEFLAAVEKIADNQTFILGEYGRELEGKIAGYCGVKHAIGCASGSDALRLALMALDIGPGDEVVVPTFTFYATAGSVAAVGARPVFCDVDPKTFNCDVRSMERAMTGRTKAMIVVHLFGQCADMDEIRRLAEKRNVYLIEDVAQAIGAEYDGRRAGSIGDIGCFSFYPTKNLGGAGDGGMVTTSDDNLARKLKMLRVHGEEKKYYYAYCGINSRLDEIQAAYLLVKFPHLERYHEMRCAHARAYDAGFTGLPLQTPFVVARCRMVYNQYCVVTSQRDELAAYLAEAGIGTTVYYPHPLHLVPCFADLGYKKGDLPVGERLCSEVLALPIFPELEERERSDVIEKIGAFFKGGR